MNFKEKRELFWMWLKPTHAQHSTCWPQNSQQMLIDLFMPQDCGKVTSCHVWCQQSYVQFNIGLVLGWEMKSLVKSFGFLRIVWINPFTPTDCFSVIQNNEWKSPCKLLSVERVKATVCFWLSVFTCCKCVYVNNNIFQFIHVVNE